MAVFPTGFPDQTVSRTSVVLIDNGTANGRAPVSAILGQLALTDMQNKLMGALDTIEDVASNVTSYAIVATDQNKTKRFLCTGACTVTAPINMPIGFLVDWIQFGDGVLTFAAGAGGASVSTPNGFRSGAKFSRGTLEVVAANHWVLSGYTQV